MGPIKKTDDQAHVEMHKTHESVIEHGKHLLQELKSKEHALYKKAVLVSGFLTNKIDTTVGRAVGAAYYAKGIHALVSTFEGVKIKELKEIKNDTGKSVAQKIGHIADHVIKGTSHEGLVATTVFLGKHAVIGALVAGGPATVVAVANDGERL
jgi:hypothetical protein